MLTQAEREQRSLRLRRFAIRETAKRVLVIVVVAAVLGFFMWSRRGQAVDPLRQRAVAELCNAAYARARSTADSSRVDQYRPIVDKATAAAGLSCSEMRREGRLAP